MSHAQAAAAAAVNHTALVAAIQVCGYAATICFALLLFPQVVLNQQRRSTKGLSLALVVLWHMAALLYLPYLLYVDEAFPLLLQWGLFALASIILEMQFVAFPHPPPPPPPPSHEEDKGEETGAEEEEEQMDTTTSTKRTPARRLSSTHLLLLGLGLASTLLSVGCILGLFSFFSSLKGRRGAGIITALGSGASSVCLALGFLPQLHLICKEKSSQGLSLGLCALDLTGSSLSILVLGLESVIEKRRVEVGGVVPYAIIVAFQLVVMFLALVVYPDPGRFGKASSSCSVGSVFGHGAGGGDGGRKEENEAVAVVVDGTVEEGKTG